MEVFRISAETYATKLTSSGSANRWNFDSQEVLYTGSSRSLASLELIVHKNSIKPGIRYMVMIISLADYDHLIRTISLEELPPNWRTFDAYSDLQKIGSDWYSTQETLILKVPSAIIPLEYNYIINTQHPDFGSHIKLVRTEKYFWDDRLK
ncbi:RES family NAD+ phosphorylase [Algibacter sp. 2305UL17-15]|uniref:RES family NAD+ phosphorylase n=1 Tax=Algibacter sp. 2305UL17-15 TaxID=3231268 RepID=UPI003459D598